MRIISKKRIVIDAPQPIDVDWFKTLAPDMKKIDEGLKLIRQGMEKVGSGQLGIQGYKVPELNALAQRIRKGITSLAKIHDDILYEREVFDPKSGLSGR